MLELMHSMPVLGALPLKMPWQVQELRQTKNIQIHCASLSLKEDLQQSCGLVFEGVLFFIFTTKRIYNLRLSTLKTRSGQKGAGFKVHLYKVVL